MRLIPIRPLSDFMRSSEAADARRNAEARQDGRQNQRRDAARQALQEAQPPVPPPRPATQSGKGAPGDNRLDPARIVRSLRNEMRELIRSEMDARFNERDDLPEDGADDGQELAGEGLEEIAGATERVASTRLGHLLVRTDQGWRAAIMPLNRGLYLVAEVQEQALSPEFGVAPALAPLVVNAAVKALESPRTQAAIHQGVENIHENAEQRRDRREGRREDRRSDLSDDRREDRREDRRDVRRDVRRDALPPAPAAAPVPMYPPGVPYGWPMPPWPPGAWPWPPPVANAHLAPGFPPAPHLRRALPAEALPWADSRDFAGETSPLLIQY